MKRIVIFVLLTVLFVGCASNADQELSILQTQVAELSQERTETATNNSDIDVIAYADVDRVPALKDEVETVLQLTNKLVEKGWAVSDINENAFWLYTPEDTAFLIEYRYESQEISRLIVYSLWPGKGISNLDESVLVDINTTNDEQALTKVSIDADGDIWLETYLPVSESIYVQLFCDYVEWFEESEVVFVLTYLSDYLQEEGTNYSDILES